jgi:hypothetical protein
MAESGYKSSSSLVLAGDKRLFCSVTVFGDRTGPDAANRLAAEYVHRHLAMRLTKGGGGPNQALGSGWKGFRDLSTGLIENIPWLVGWLVGWLITKHPDLLVRVFVSDTSTLSN